MKKNVKIALGLTLLPFVIILFAIDRILCVPLFWIDSYSWKKWSNKDNEVFHSLLRALAFTVLYLIIKFVTWIF